MASIGLMDAAFLAGKMLAINPPTSRMPKAPNAIAGFIEGGSNGS